MNQAFNRDASNAGWIGVRETGTPYGLEQSIRTWETGTPCGLEQSIRTRETDPRVEYRVPANQPAPKPQERQASPEERRAELTRLRQQARAADRAS